MTKRDSGRQLHKLIEEKNSKVQVTGFKFARVCTFRRSARLQSSHEERAYSNRQVFTKIEHTFTGC